MNDISKLADIRKVHFDRDVYEPAEVSARARPCPSRAEVALPAERRVSGGSGLHSRLTVRRQARP